MNEQETRALRELAQETVKELRARRHGRWIKRGFWLLLVGWIIFSVLHDPAVDRSLGAATDKHIALIEIEGVISAQDYANAHDVSLALEQAFSEKNVVAVFLQINSPGGSPVQAGQIYRQIVRLKAEHRLPVYAFIDDMGASGAYYIAAAADRIYADPASVVGSIGVISSGIGYGELLQKLGVSDRTFTAGENKDFLNPAEPLNPVQVEHMQGVLDDLHAQFIEAVKAGRGARLSAAQDAQLFSGLFWSGRQAQTLGLVDSLEDMPVVIKAQFADMKTVNYSPERSAWEELLRHSSMQGKAALREFSGVGEQVQAILAK